MCVIQNCVLNELTARFELLRHDYVVVVVVVILELYFVFIFRFLFFDQLW